MAISERDIKLLWGRAAGRCSICRIAVTADKQSVTDAYPFGENAHIVAEKNEGPRGSAEMSPSLRNSYFNLILLCPNCHTKIDKSPEDYPPDKLHQIKRDHESEMNQLHPANKDSYDQYLEFSRLTKENWLSPDRKHYIPIGIGQEEWAAAFLEPQLASAVPRNVIKLFEVARASIIYAWFFYPLATLGFEQLNRVGEYAVRERCISLNYQPGDFTTNLNTLIQAGLISPLDQSRWRATGQLSHSRSHITSPMLIDLGIALEALRGVADMINVLFQPASNKTAQHVIDLRSRGTPPSE